MFLFQKAVRHQKGENYPAKEKKMCLKENTNVNGKGSLLRLVKTQFKSLKARKLMIRIIEKTYDRDN